MWRTAWLLILIAYMPQESILCLHPSIVINWNQFVSPSNRTCKNVFSWSLSNTMAFLGIQISQHAVLDINSWICWWALHFAQLPNRLLVFKVIQYQRKQTQHTIGTRQNDNKKQMSNSSRLTAETTSLTTIPILLLAWLCFVHPIF